MVEWQELIMATKGIEQRQNTFYKRFKTQGAWTKVVLNLNMWVNSYKCSILRAKQVQTMEKLDLFLSMEALFAEYFYTT